MVAPGKLWGVGLGPGDPELVTVKAARVISAADVVAFHSAKHGRSISRATAEPYLRPGQLQEHLIYPVTTEVTDHPGGYSGAITEFYERSAQVLAGHLRAGRSVALLAAGDPTFYSSYLHMHVRLANEFAAEIIPGVTSVSAAAAAAGQPQAMGDEVLTILPGTLPQPELARRLRDTDAAAIIKLGRTFPAIQGALAETGRLTEATYVERASSARQRVLPAGEADPAGVPYFSLTLVSAPAQATAPAPAAGEVVVVGLGPGAEGWLTPETRAALDLATDIVGYVSYVKRLLPRPGQRLHASDNRVESERAAMALDLARRGARVAVVSSGDPGVFAMASAVLEQARDWPDVPVRVLPGVTAANAVASKAGAPLGHDYAVISLSDYLKSWDTVAQRISAAAAADMAIAIYNPASRTRTWQVAALRELLLAHRAADTPVIVGRAVGSADESVRIVKLAGLDSASVDMRTLLIIGSSTTTVADTAAGPRVFTPRSYPR